MKKSWFINLLKISVASMLIYWLFSQGKLTAESFTIFWEKPFLLPCFFVAWALGPVSLGSARWQALLRGAGLELNFFLAVRLTLIGAFFNSAMPGAVGGDLVKGYYVAKGQKNRTGIFVSLLVDRLVGLFGLVTVGCIAISIAIGDIWAFVLLRPVILFSYGLFLGFCCFFGFVLYSPKPLMMIFEKIFGFHIPGMGILKRIFDSVMTYRDHKKSIILGYLYSILLQAVVVFYISILALKLQGGSTGILNLMSVIPICILTTAIPIAPGGLGVGHLAFEKIFQLIQIEGGANVFTTFFISQLVLSMLGAIPYLLHKSEIKSPGEAEAEMAGETVDLQASSTES